MRSQRGSCRSQSSQLPSPSTSSVYRASQRKGFDAIAQRLIDSGDLIGDDMLAARIAVEQQLEISLACGAFAGEDLDPGKVGNRARVTVTAGRHSRDFGQRLLVIAVCRERQAAVEIGQAVCEGYRDWP